MITDSRTKWAIFNNPLPLLEIKNKKIISAIDSYLPYSVGMEIECEHGYAFNVSSFNSIPDIMSVNNSDPEFEQRYRIPKGLLGLVCLYRICEQLKLNCKYHPESGHHYHLDCTDVYSDQFIKIAQENSEWIIKELEDWKYTGTYNSKAWGGWYRINMLQTLEFRCADMTFDYPVMAKRIIHASNIVRRLKSIKIKGPEEAKLEQLNLALTNMKKSKEEKLLSGGVFRDVAQEVVKTRIKRI